MNEPGRVPRGSRTSSAFGSVVLPVVILLIVIAILTGLVFGGVLQGEAERPSRQGGTTTESTMIIEF